MTLKGIKRISPAAGAVLTVAALALAPSGATAHTAAGAKRRKRFTTMLRNLVCNGPGTTRHRASVILGGREVIVS